MNRKMRRMLAKKGGNMEGILSNPQVSQMLDNTNVGDLMKVMKDPKAKGLFKALKKHKKDEGTCVCPECGEETHYKGALCKCEHCDKYIIVPDICGDELKDNEEMDYVLKVLNGEETISLEDDEDTNEVKEDIKN